MVNLVDAEDWPLQPEWRRIGAIDFGQEHPERVSSGGRWMATGG